MLQLKVLDIPWNLVSSRKVVIDADLEGLKKGNIVKVWKGGKKIAAVIEEVSSSSKRTIRMDNDFRENLNVKIGDLVNVERFENPSAAVEVEILVHEEIEITEQEVKDFLLSKPIMDGNKEYLKEKNLSIMIGKTVPKGIVSISPETKISIRKLVKATAHDIVEGGKKNQLDISTEKPNINFDDIGGLDEVKELLRENIVYAVEKAELYDQIGYRPTRGIMLYGLPGVGKTLIAKATASEADANFIHFPTPRLKDKWFGESERKMREIFDLARENSPCILFFDEIDSIAVQRDDMKVNVVNQLLVLMDEIADEEVFVIAATNLIESIDKALLRPGRFIHIEVPKPNQEARIEIFRINLRGTELSEGEYLELAKITQEQSGADIMNICNKAKLLAMRETDFSAETILTIRHLKEAAKSKGLEVDDLPMYV